VAYEAKVQVHWDPAAVTRYRLLGYERRDLPDSAFRDRAADGGEIGAGHAVTALYEVELADTARTSRRLGTVHLRYRGGDAAAGAGGELIEIEAPIQRRQLVDRWSEAAPGFRLAAAGE
ncbi:MAG: YfbK domain-containing protein, partial [Acidobacteriota bacterium]